MESINTLQSILEQQNLVAAELLDQGEKELEALKTTDLEALQRIMDRQRILGASLAKLEQTRLKLQAGLSRDFSLPDNFCLRDLAERGIPGSQEIIPLGKALADNYEKLRELNETNNLLIRQSLGLLNRLTGLFAAQDITYGRSGRIDGISQSAGLDKSV